MRTGLITWRTLGLAVALVGSTLPMLAASMGAAGGHSEDVLEYPWSLEEQRQRQEAIEKRDRSLLPECTEEYYTWRSATKEAREAKGETDPPSTDFWSRPGCKGSPDREVRGPKGSPSAVFVSPDKWYIGQYTSNETTYDNGAYAEMQIIDPGVDHSTNDDFFAARVLIAGDNGHSLEGGWYEGAFAGDTDQHIYGQDSHSCSGGTCTWAHFDSTCDNTRDDAQVAIDPDNSTDWTSSCWDGNQWNTMHSQIDLGDNDADFMEVAGEIKRTVSGEVNLGNGVNFREIDVQSGSTWYDWSTSVGTGLYDSDSAYTRDGVSNYTEFNMTN